jgi:tetratricopeptide (TPR) repeat protein
MTTKPPVSIDSAEEFVDSILGDMVTKSPVAPSPEAQDGRLAAALRQKTLPEAADFNKLAVDFWGRNWLRSVIELATHDLEHGKLNAQGYLLAAVSAMKFKKFAMAKTFIDSARTLDPNDPAIYVNYGEILLFEGDLAGCKEWLDLGLCVSPNHPRLWQLAYSLNRPQDSTPTASEAIHTQESNELSISGAFSSWLKRLADTHDSWMGTCLYFDSSEPENHRAKRQALQDFYDRGERSAEFLIELTASMGITMDYDAIGTVIWDIEGRIMMSTGSPKSPSSSLPWQVYLHGAQAKWAQGLPRQALDLLDKASGNSQADHGLILDLKQRMLKEASEPNLDQTPGEK